MGRREFRFRDEAGTLQVLRFAPNAKQAVIDPRQLIERRVRALVTGEIVHSGVQLV